MKTIKKVITILMTICIIFIALPVRSQAFYSEDPDAQKVAAQAEGLFKACRKYNIKKIRSYCVHSNNLLHIKDKTIQKQIKKSQKKYFSAEINNIVVDGDNALVTVTVTNFNSYLLGQAWFKECVNRKLKNNNWSGSDSLRLLNKWYKYWIKTCDPESDLWSDTVTLKFKKHKGKWKLSKNNNTLYDMMDGGLVHVLRRASKNPLKIYFE